jgi:hypothetical protein
MITLFEVRLFCIQYTLHHVRDRCAVRTWKQELQVGYIINILRILISEDEVENEMPGLLLLMSLSFLSVSVFSERKI